MSDKDDRDFLDAVARFGKEFLEKNPHLEDLVESARVGTMDAKEAVKQIWKTAAENKSFQSDVEKALFEAFQIEPGSTDLAHFPERQKMLDRLNSHSCLPTQDDGYAISFF